MKATPVILVIAGESEVLAETSRILNRAAYLVMQARNGDEGIEIALRKVPDLVILDAVLGNEDGIGVCRRLTAESSLANTFVTLASDKELAAEKMVAGLDAGADEWFQRPYRSEEFLARIRALLRRQKSGTLPHRKTEDMPTEGHFSRAVIDAMTEGFSILDHDGIHIHVNKAFCEMTGFPRAELVGTGPPHPYWPPEEYEQIEQAFKKTTGGDFGEFELTFMRKNGQRFPALVAPSMLTGEDGSPTTFFATVKDITAQKNAENALHESEGKYRTLVEGALQGVVIAQNNPMRIRFANKAMETLTGFTVEQLELFGPDELTSLVSDADRERFFDNFKRRISGEDMPAYNEYRIVHKDGSEPWVRIYASRIEYLGEPATLTVFIDVTEQRQSEEALRLSKERYRTLSENIAIGVAMISKDMRIQTLNRQMRTWFPAIDAATTPVCYQAFNNPPRTGPCSYCPTIHTLQDGEVHEATTDTPTPDGVRHYRIISTPVRDKDGEIVAAIEMVEDLTDRIRAENEKKVVEEALRQSQKMEAVGRLAGGVAHDFNNMLTVIRGHAEMALEEIQPDHALHGDLTEIKHAAERSADLTRQLLAFARKQTISPVVLDLNRTVSGMINMLQRLIGEDIDLVWTPSRDLMPVKIDPGQVDQIMANLCVNARDSIAGVGKVTIETGNIVLDEGYCADHPGFIPGNYVFLAISDDGEGMDAETLENIFEPFFTTKACGEGTGLGLATVYGVVKQNNGFINVRSEPGHGATFTIFLPQQPGRQAPRLESAHTSPKTRGNETILLVEDEPSILRMTATMLERDGYTVLAANTPGEAIQLAERLDGDLHLIISDVVMPEMNGHDLSKNILSRLPHLKCLFMSGYTSNVIANHGLLGEGLDLIQKPFTKESLTAKVREMLDRDVEN